MICQSYGNRLIDGTLEHRYAMEILRKVLTAIVPLFWFACLFVFPFAGTHALIRGVRLVARGVSFKRFPYAVSWILFGALMLLLSAVFLWNVFESGK